MKLAGRETRLSNQLAVREVRKLDSQIRSRNGQRNWLPARLGEFDQSQGQVREQSWLSGKEIETLKQQRKDTFHHVAVKSVPEQDRFTRLSKKRKRSIATIKTIAWRAESSMASLLREHPARGGDAGSLPRQVFHDEADLVADRYQHPDGPSTPPHAGRAR